MDPSLTHGANLRVATDALYLLITVLATVWVARTLRTHGRAFLTDTFPGDGTLATAVNDLLVVGFYLINIGWVCLNVKDGQVPHNVADMIEGLGTQVGTILMVLGGMHFFNLYVFSRIRRRALSHKAPPPVLPSQMISPPRAA